MTSTEGCSVFLLEDRAEVLESTTDLLNAHGICAIGASEPNEAWEVLEEKAPDIKVALIDKNIGSDRSAGLTFLVKAQEAFAGIRFFLITAWDLDPEEMRLIQQKGVNVLEKVRVSGSSLVSVCLGEEQLSDHEESETNPLRESSNDVEVLESRIANTRDQLHETLIRARSLQLQKQGLSTALGRFGQSLIRQLENDRSTDDSDILFDGKPMSYPELVEEIRKGTGVGIALIDAHLGVFEELAQDRRAGWRKWFPF